MSQPTPQHKSPRSSASPDKKFIERLGVAVDSVLYETVATREGLQFATSDGRMTPQVEELGRIIRPPLGLQVFADANCLALPSEAARGASAETLSDEIKAIILRYADVPEGWLEPLVAYVLMTWVYDRFSSLPYLRFLGEPGTGKTRLLEIMAALGFRSLKVSGNITGAGLFRTIDLVRGTLAVDEADYRNSQEWSEIIKVFNNGYRDGIPVIRCGESTGQRRYNPEPFVVYGPKIISTRRRFVDTATESRCLTFETAERVLAPGIPTHLPPEFWQEARTLRNRLLGWRFDHFHRIRPDDLRLRHLPPRLTEIGSALAAVAPNSDAIIEYLNRYAADVCRGSARGILQAILAETKTWPVLLETLRVQLNEALEAAGQEPMGSRAVGPIVRALGYQTARRNSGTVVLEKPKQPGERQGERVNVGPGCRVSL